MVSGQVRAGPRRRSGHQEVSEGQHGGSDTHCDQDIVGTQIVHGIEGLIGFFGHAVSLRGLERIACEVVHIPTGIFSAKACRKRASATRRIERWSSGRAYGGAARIGSCGCPRWWTPWSRPRDPRCAPSLARRPFSSVCAPSSRNPCRTILLRPRRSAGAIETYSPASLNRGWLFRSRARS
jgi:hypothetical protein